MSDKPPTIYSNDQPVEVTPPEAAQATQGPRGDLDDYTSVPGKLVKTLHIMPEGCCAVQRGLLEDVLEYLGTEEDAMKAVVSEPTGTNIDSFYVHALELLQSLIRRLEDAAGKPAESADDNRLPVSEVGPLGIGWPE